MKLTNILIITCFFLASCTQEVIQRTEKAEVDNLYTIELPADLQRTNTLHDFAPLQATDPYSEAYLIGLNDSKLELSRLNLDYDLETYAWVNRRKVSQALDSVFEKCQTELTLDGNRTCIISDVEGEVFTGRGLVPVSYRIATIEGPSHFFQFLYWGEKDEVVKREPEFISMIHSFNELNPGQMAQNNTNLGAGSAGE